MLLDPLQRRKLFRLAPAKECHHARTVWQCLSVFTRWPSGLLKAIDAAILAPDPAGCLRQLLPKPTLIIGKTKAQFLVGGFGFLHREIAPDFAVMSRTQHHNAAIELIGIGRVHLF